MKKICGNLYTQQPTSFHPICHGDGAQSVMDALFHPICHGDGAQSVMDALRADPGKWPVPATRAGLINK